jgi:superfamily II DNA or RNA helicase
VFNKALEVLQQKKGTIITLPCGYGKTNIAIAIASKLNLKTLVLCNTIEQLNQWVHRVKQCIQSPVEIGIIQQNVCQITDCDFTIASIHTILARQYTNLIYDLLIVDEVHHIAAPIFCRALKKIKFQYTLGLTATIQRKDNLHKAIYYLIGKPCVHLLCGKQNVLQFSHPDYINVIIPHRPEVQVNLIDFQNKGLPTQRNHYQSYNTMISGLYQDHKRNILLYGLVHAMQQPNRKGLLLSSRVAHLEILYKSLGDKMCEIFTGKLCTMKNDSTKPKQFTKFLTLSTYQKFSEAIDFTGNFIILATPTNAIEQCTGRILRGKQSNTRPVIIDVCDSILPTMSRRRRKYYQSRGYEIINLDCAF